MTRGPCFIEGCTGRRFGYGLCQKHYHRRMKGRPLITWRERFLLDNPPCDGMGKVPLHQNGRYALVDESDYARVIEKKWHFNSFTGYAYCRIGERKVTLHRFVMNEPEWPIDHQNRVKSDCRRSNLRRATPSQNSWNHGVSKRNRSGFKGVSFDSSRGKWLASIGHKGKVHLLGRFDEAEDAAVAYDIAAQLFHGDFAVTNSLFPSKA